MSHKHKFSAKPNSLEILQKFFLLYEFKLRSINFITKGIYIQRAWRRHHIALHNRLDGLKIAWKDEVSMLTSLFAKRKGAYTALVGPINSIDLEIRDRVCDLYMARQNLMHTVKFLQWTLIKRGAIKDKD